MAKDQRNLIVIGVILVIVCSAVAVGFFLFNPAYNPPPNFQVYFEGWLREDIGQNPYWASKVVEVFTDGGETYEEQITSAADGKLSSANMYWVGEEVTVQVRHAAPGATAATDPYVMAPVTFTVPAAGESGDTVSIGTIWGRDPSTASPTMALTDQDGNAISDASSNDIDLADNEINVLLSGVSSGEGWGVEDEFVDLITGYTYIGAYIVLNSTSMQPIANYDKLVQASSENFYMFHIGRIINDPAIVGDGSASLTILTTGANWIADASIMVDAYDMIRWEDAVLGLMEAYELVGVAQVDTRAA